MRQRFHVDSSAQDTHYSLSNNLGTILCTWANHINTQPCLSKQTSPNQASKQCVLHKRKKWQINTNILIYLWQFGHRLNISNQNSSTREHFGSETSSERGNFGVVKRPWCSKPLENCPSAVQQSHPFQQNLVYTEKYTDILHQRSPAWLWGGNAPNFFT